jgi:hypothetical protein
MNAWKYNNDSHIDGKLQSISIHEYQEQSQMTGWYNDRRSRELTFRALAIALGAQSARKRDQTCSDEHKMSTK